MKTTKLYELKSLVRESEKDDLIQKVLPLVKEVFPGLAVEDLKSVLFNSKALSLRFYLFTDCSKITGFHLFSHYSYKGGIIFRVFSCLSDKAKGDKSLENLSFRELLRARLVYFTKKLTFFTCYVNPVPYYVMLENMYYAYPHFEKETPKEKYLELLELADYFELERVPNRFELVRKTPAIGTVNEKEISRINKSNKPAIKKFIEWCPTYLEGHGLITMAPMTWKNVLFSTLKKINILK